MEPSFERRLRKSLVRCGWTNDSLRHPVVVTAGPCERVWLKALYFDGVPFLKRDGLLGLMLCNLCSAERHLLSVELRSDLCRCGCLGWFTLWVVLDFVNRTVAELAEEDHAEEEARRHAFGPPTTGIGYTELAKLRCEESS